MLLHCFQLFLQYWVKSVMTLVTRSVSYWTNRQDGHWKRKLQVHSAPTEGELLSSFHIINVHVGPFWVTHTHKHNSLSCIMCVCMPGSVLQNLKAHCRLMCKVLVDDEGTRIIILSWLNQHKWFSQSENIPGDFFFCFRSLFLLLLKYKIDYFFFTFNNIYTFITL